MESKEQAGNLFVCHECDALQTIKVIEPGNVAACVCCGSTLFKNPVDGVEKPLALIVASMIFFIVANLYPIITLNIAGIERAATLTESALIFLKLGRPELAVTVWFCCVFLPGFIISGLLYVLLSIRYELGLPYAKPVLAWIIRLYPWEMVDVYYLGILVVLVKLVAMADVLLDTGFYAYSILIFVYAAAASLIEPHFLWECLSKQDSKPQ